jgi:hypothetical protein
MSEKDKAIKATAALEGKSKNFNKYKIKDEGVAVGTVYISKILEKQPKFLLIKLND